MQDAEATGSPDPAQNELAETDHPIIFTGKGNEYFGIWIVNLLLTLVTLGIYSAWAKVRRMQYFYRNTLLAGASFDYHGNPVAILKGRLIAIALLVAYNLAGTAHPFLGLAVGAVILAVLPRLILKSLQFRLHNSSYRGLRFRFNGTLKQSYLTFLLLPLATVFTFYLLAPFCHQRIKSFQHNNSAFGQSSFSFNAPVSAFYGLYLKVWGFLILGVIVLGVVAAMVFGNPFLMTNAKANPQLFTVISMLFFFGFFILLLFIRPFLEARLQNLIWNHTQLGPHRFVSNISAGKLFGIMFTNLIGVIFTLGLFRPFAVTRLLKYRLETVTLAAAGDLDSFLSAHNQEVGAMGEETADIFDIDIAL
ncbi:MAG: YjgN family protein [Betaproteobacteria bacterium]